MTLLAALVLLHVGLAVGYSLEIPYRHAGISNGRFLPDIGAPDEEAHAAFVQQLRDGGGLPVLDPNTTDPQGDYEAHQPPLYYWLAARAADVMGLGRLREPDTGVPLRWLNAVIGGITVVGTYFLGLWTTGRRELALGVAGIAALLPMMAFLSGAVSNDPLTVALCTWCLALCVRARSGWHPAMSVGIGLLAGLAMLSKSTAILLVPAVAVELAMARAKTATWIVCLGIALALPLPWWIRNIDVYGHPLALNAFFKYFHGDVDTSQLMHSPYALAHWIYVFGAGTALSFIGIFGYMDIHLPYAIYLPLLVVFFICALAATRDERRRTLINGLGLFLALVVLGYIRYNLWQVQPQARYLFMAIGPIALPFVIGLARLTSSRYRWGIAALLAFLLAANVLALVQLPGAYRVRVDAAAKQR